MSKPHIIFEHEQTIPDPSLKLRTIHVRFKDETLNFTTTINGTRAEIAAYYRGAACGPSDETQPRQSPIRIDFWHVHPMTGERLPDEVCVAWALNRDEQTFADHSGTRVQVGDMVRNIESGWRGRVYWVTSCNGETMFGCFHEHGGRIEYDDVQWHSPADVRRVASRGPVVSLACACCGRLTRGRQWWNRDTGYGLCPDCVQICRAGSMDDHEFFQSYGIPGLHFAVVE